MKPLHKNIAIAEAIGTHMVTRLPIDGGVQIHVADQNGRIWNIVDYEGGPISQSLPMDFESIPDYSGDLNASHEMEKTLKCSGILTSQRDKFISELVNIAGPTDAFSATAPQRAEAYLRTIDKWEEQP